MSVNTSLTPCPPWLQSVWESIYKRHTESKLAHALLFTGVEGIGKKQFVQFVAESLLCLNPDAVSGACGQCNSCMQLSAQSHADFYRLDPAGASYTITVEPVRELIAWLQLSAPANQYRVAMIDHADVMNRNAANSLLKTLEEPGARAILLLAADMPGALPATIRSRCQQIVLQNQSPELAIKWLQEEHGISNAESALAYSRYGPFKLLDQLDEKWLSDEVLLRKAWLDLFLARASIGKISQSLADIPSKRCLQSFSHWTALSLKIRENIDIGVDPAELELVMAMQGKLNTEQCFTLFDRLQLLFRSDSASFKTQTVLEGLFADIRINAEN